jgi:hypothetical protein
MPIWESRVDHRQAYEGDGGVRFEAREAGVEVIMAAGWARLS